MRSGFGKLIAVLLAVLLALPAAALADDDHSKYYDATFSDVVVNYAGTEFDFSGISLSLAAGADADSRNALLGAVAKLDSTGDGAGLAVQLNAEDMLILLGNQLLKVPYANMEDALNLLGVQSTGQLGDLSERMEQFWTLLSSGDDIQDNFEDLLNQYSAGLQGNALSQQINAMLAEAVPEAATFTVDGVEYQGQKVSVTIGADMLNGLLASEEMQAYYAQITEMQSRIFGQLGVNVIDVNGTPMSIEDFVTLVTSAASSISYVDDMAIDVYMAPYDDENTVVLIDYSPYSIDMSKYLSLLGGYAGATATGVAQTIITCDESMAMIGELSEGKILAFDEAEFLELDAQISNPQGGDPISLGARIVDRDGQGSLSMDMLVPGSATGESGRMAIAADWSDQDDAQAANFNFEMYTNDVLSASMSFSGNSAEKDSGDSAEYTLKMSDNTGTDITANLSYNYAEADDDTGEGNLTLQLDDGTTGLMPVASIDFSSAKSETDDADVLDLVFSANFMGMISASGKLTLREMPMNAELVLNGEGALDLSTASAEDMQAMQVNLQTSLQTLLLNAMSVPGVQQIMTITNVESVTPADDAATEVITEEATEVTDEAIAG